MVEKWKSYTYNLFARKDFEEKERKCKEKICLFFFQKKNWIKWNGRKTKDFFRKFHFSFLLKVWNLEGKIKFMDLLASFSFFSFFLILMAKSRLLTFQFLFYFRGVQLYLFLISHTTLLFEFLWIKNYFRNFVILMVFLYINSLQCLTIITQLLCNDYFNQFISIFYEWLQIHVGHILNSSLCT